MKKIVLDINYSNLKGNYYISLERGNKIEFKTKRKANEFKSEYKKFITDNLNALIYNYKTIYNVFLDYYLQFDTRTTSILNQLNEVIIKKFDLILTDFGQGWNGLIFQNFESAYFYINDLILKIKHYSQKFKIQNLIHQCNSILHSYENNFKSFRNCQELINVNLNYRKKQTLKIVHRINATKII